MPRAYSSGDFAVCSRCGGNRVYEVQNIIQYEVVIAVDEHGTPTEYGGIGESVIENVDGYWCDDCGGRTPRLEREHSSPNGRPEPIDREEE